MADVERITGSFDVTLEPGAGERIRSLLGVDKAGEPVITVSGVPGVEDGKRFRVVDYNAPQNDDGTWTLDLVEDV